eukprot:TRINITY_DN3227_c2_g3_i2.p1 TRINITY_DN3227_c2_g3~~TRINITY_DN3227_c2_g3_i2.p1  ORF type:complete len:88 (-),score=19.84 TRINITY_DN3227_c2_g3_i2:33-296(-)
MMDAFQIIRHPINNETALFKMENLNTMTYIVDPHASKNQIKQAFYELYEITPARVNTLNCVNGGKKAYITLPKDVEALVQASKIGIL